MRFRLSKITPGGEQAVCLRCRVIAAFCPTFFVWMINPLWLRQGLPNAASLLLDVILFVVIPALSIAWLRNSRQPRGVLPAILPRNWFAELGSVLFLGVVAAICAVLVLYPLDRALQTASDGPLDSYFRRTFDVLGSPTVSLVYVVTVSSVFEEFWFRYLPLCFLTLCKWSDSTKHLVFLFLSPILFGLVHWTAGGAAMLLAALFGVMLAEIFWRTRNILMTITIHLTVNFLVLWVGGKLS